MSQNPTNFRVLVSKIMYTGNNMQNKWSGFSSKDYLIKNLGRPAIFLLPTKKLNKELGGETVKNNLHRFLIKNFGSYTTSVVPQFGFWKKAKKSTVVDECHEYEVSFLGKNRIPLLIKKLSEIASATKEECVYLKAGQYSCLVYPRRAGEKS